MSLFEVLTFVISDRLRLLLIYRVVCVVVTLACTEGVCVILCSAGLMKWAWFISCLRCVGLIGAYVV